MTSKTSKRTQQPAGDLCRTQGPVVGTSQDSLTSAPSSGTSQFYRWPALHNCGNSDANQGAGLTPLNKQNGTSCQTTKELT